MTYRREIDGLRAVAVIPVILFHAGFTSFSGGFIGVDVFFVISGFLITSVIRGEVRAGTFSIAGFYERRARRILPALFLIMAACVPLAWMWLLPGDMKSFSQSLVAVSALSSNVLFFLTSGYFENAAELKPLLHTWSLAVEEQFYVVYPLLAAWLLRRGDKVFVAGLAGAAGASFVLAEWTSRVHPEFAFFLLPTRGWELLIGAFVATAPRPHVPDSGWHRDVVPVVALALVLVPVFTFDATTPFPGTFALSPTVGAALLIGFATPATLVGRLLGSRLLVGVGLISYSAYLWHQPLLAFARHRSALPPGPVLMGTVVIISMVLAFASWKYLETPFRRRERISLRQLAGFCLCCWAGMMMLGAIGHASGGFPTRVPAEVRAIAGASEDRSRRPECLLSTYADPSTSCVLGNDGAIVGALIGDSQASALSEGLERLLAGTGLGLRQMTFEGCPPVRGVYREGDVDCTRYNDAVQRWLTGHPREPIVVLAARWSLYVEGARFNNGEGGIEPGVPAHVDTVEGPSGPRRSDADRRRRLAGRYQASVTALLDAGKQVFLVYPIPEVGWDVPRYAAKRRLFNGLTADVTTRMDVFAARNAETIRTLDAIGDHPRLVRVRPDARLCGTFVDDRCSAQLDGVPLYFDAIHPTNAGARLIVEQMRQAFEDAGRGRHAMARDEQLE